jgi:hypothetical protein
MVDHNDEAGQSPVRLRVADTLVTRKICQPDDIALWKKARRQTGFPE